MDRHLAIIIASRADERCAFLELLVFGVALRILMANDLFEMKDPQNQPRSPLCAPARVRDLYYFCWRLSSRRAFVAGRRAVCDLLFGWRLLDADPLAFDG